MTYQGYIMFQIRHLFNKSEKAKVAYKCDRSEYKKELRFSPFRQFGEIKIQKKKVVNYSGTHLMVGPTAYFMSLSLTKLHLSFIFINGEDFYPIKSKK